MTLRWLVQQPNVVVIQKASSEAHLRENLGGFDFVLTDVETETGCGLVERVRRLLG